MMSKLPETGKISPEIFEDLFYLRLGGSENSADRPGGYSLDHRTGLHSP